MAAPAPSTRRKLPLVDAEQRMVVHGVSWKDYVILREALDTPGLRMTYCEGTLELTSPSRKHEVDKKGIARLIELYAFLRDLPLNGYGSTTFCLEAKERGAEPDECYALGRVMKEGEFPDIVLEVIHTNPILDKLYVYQGFGIPEVWLFRNAAFELYALVDGTYEPIATSRYFPSIDFAQIARLAQYEDQQQALRELRNSLD